jgi:hypothetical protein
MQPSDHAVEFARRPATASDDSFLVVLYASTRQDLDVVGSNAAQKNFLLRCNSTRNIRRPIAEKPHRCERTGGENRDAREL